MSAGWSLREDVAAGLEPAAAERLATVLRDGEARPGLVLRLDPLVIATPRDERIDLLLVDHPSDAELIRRCRLRLDARLTVIVDGAASVIGERVGTGDAPTWTDGEWQALRERAFTQIQQEGWIVRDGAPLHADAPAPLDRVAAPRQVVVREVEVRQRPRRWGLLLLGIALVIVLKLLILALRGH